MELGVRPPSQTKPRKRGIPAPARGPPFGTWLPGPPCSRSRCPATARVNPSLSWLPEGDCRAGTCWLQGGLWISLLARLIFVNFCLFLVCLLQSAMQNVMICCTPLHFRISTLKLQHKIYMPSGPSHIIIRIVDASPRLCHQPWSRRSEQA